MESCDLWTNSDFDSYFCVHDPHDPTTPETGFLVSRLAIRWEMPLLLMVIRDRRNVHDFCFTTKLFSQVQSQESEFVYFGC